MKPKSFWVTILVSLFIATGCFSPGAFAGAPLGPEHYIAKYVPWGIDEFELFGLNKPQLEKNYGKQLKFDFGDKESYARFNKSGGGPQFILTLENGRVSAIRRLFIDGEGCHILGPVLKSKQEALQFSIDGLTKLGSTDPNDKTKLATARKLLHETEVSATSTSQHR